MQHEKLVGLFQHEFERCKVRKGETAIVLTGDHSPAPYAKAALQAIRNLGAGGFQMHMPPPGDGRDGYVVGKTAVTGQRLAVETLKQADFVVSETRNHVFLTDAVFNRQAQTLVELPNEVKAIGVEVSFIEGEFHDDTS